MQIGIKVKFWGVRGSVPTAGVKYIKYGGNTPCVEIRLPDNKLFVFDAGTGVRELGSFICSKEEKVKIHLFLSHFHWDHIQGLPFFMPAYIKGNEIIVYGMDIQGARLDKIISEQMESVYFPVKLQSLSANITFRTMSEGSNNIDGVKVDTVYLNHPGHAIGFVINFKNIKICYITDNELVPKSGTDNTRLKYRSDTRERILKLINGADLLIHDAQYTDEEYKARIGWGHSSFSEVMSLAIESGVRRLALFHHDYNHSDDQIDFLMANCNCKTYDNENSNVIDCFAAHEGMELHF